MDPPHPDEAQYGQTRQNTIHPYLRYSSHGASHAPHHLSINASWSVPVNKNGQDSLPVLVSSEQPASAFDVRRLLFREFQLHLPGRVDIHGNLAAACQFPEQKLVCQATAYGVLDQA